MTLLYVATVATAATVRRTAEHVGDLAELLEAHAARLAPYSFTMKQR